MSDPLLRKIVEIGHHLEKLWQDLPEQTPKTLELFTELQSLIRLCAKSNDTRLSRLAFFADRLSKTMTCRHLGAQLVPFERLFGKALRDDEILVTERDVLDRERETAPLVVIADNIRSAFNVGAILRTAECFGVEEVALTGYSPTPDDIKTARTSLGAQDAVKWSHHPEATDACQIWRDRGYQIIALETALNSETLPEFIWPEKSLLIIGNERFGIDQNLLSLADHVVSIPLFGRKNSLNVGIALGVALSDWRGKIALSEKQKPHLELKPIATFHSQNLQPSDASRQGSVSASNEIGTVEFARGRNFEQALDSIEGFEKIWLIYSFHHNSNWKPQVLPPRGPHRKRGVFATRAPYRPNPIGISAVELVQVDGLKLHVRGFDLLDGTPIYDVKPYIPYADAFPNAKAGWLEKLEEISPRFDVRFSQSCETSLQWLEQNEVQQLRSFLIQQLEFDPIDNERKRVTANSAAGHAQYTIAYRTWRAHFNLDSTQEVIEVTSIDSAYSVAELAATEDPYGDKKIHREFKKSLLSAKA